MDATHSRVSRKTQLSHISITYWLFLAGIFIYLALFGFNSLTRTYYFPNDSMNYVDVARNIVSGKGIAQSTLGFNQTHFSIDVQIPTPLTSQPPLYPLLIAFLSQLGVPSADAALLISAISYGVILFVIALLAVSLYDNRVAVLLLCLLLSYYPLRFISSNAISEPPAIVFVLLTLWLLTKLDTASNKQFIIPFLAGLVSGLAFSTRYALVPLFLVGIIFLVIELKTWKRRAFGVGLYAVGVALLPGLVLARNYMVSGVLLPDTNASEIGLIRNVVYMIKALLGENLALLPLKFEFVLVSIFIALLFAVLLWQRRLVTSLKTVLLIQRRYLLSLWVVVYLAYLLYQRSVSHFDLIEARLVMPAGIILVLFLSAFIIETVPLNSKQLGYIAVALVSIAILREMWVTVTYPTFSMEQLITSSERLNWIETQTTEQDLIIGDDTVDVPFLFERSAAVSFSPYPYTDYPTYEQVTAYSDKHCDEYGHIYLVLRNRYEGEEAEWQANYGTFIADIVFGRTENYSSVSLLQSFSDGYVFKINCKSN